jgi:hypothetical protein
MFYWLTDKAVTALLLLNTVTKLCHKHFSVSDAKDRGELE